MKGEKCAPKSADAEAKVYSYQMSTWHPGHQIKLLCMFLQPLLVCPLRKVVKCCTGVFVEFEHLSLLRFY